MPKERLNLTPEAPVTPTAEQPETPTETPEAPKATPSADDLRAQAKEAVKVMFGTELPEEVPVKTTEEPKEEKPADPPAEKAETPPAEETKAETPVEPPAPTTPVAAPETPPEASDKPGMDEIITRTAQATGEAVARAIKPPEKAVEPVEPPSEVEGLNDEDQDDYKALQYLEQQNPKYAGKSAEFLAYVKKLESYRDRWEKAHPDQDFDPEAEEHNAWYDKHQPDLERRALDQAKIDMRVEEQVRRVKEKEIDPEFQAWKAQKAWEAAQPKVLTNVKAAIAQMVEGVDPELGKIVADKKEMDAALKEMDEKDPLAAAVIEQAAVTVLMPIVTELERLGTPELQVKFDPRSNNVHANIDQVRQTMEKEMSKAPVAKRTDEQGRTWLSILDFQRAEAQILNSKLSKAAIQQRLSDLDAKHWTFNVDHIKTRVVLETGQKTKQLIEQMDRLAQKKYKKAPAPTKNAAPTTPPPAAETAAPTAKPKSPTISSQSDVVVTSKSPTGEQKTFGEVAAQVMFS